jgi:hypothetical protein
VSVYLAAEVVGAVVFVGGPLVCWVSVVRRGAHHERAVLKEHSRASRAHFAAVEAAEDDPSFAPDAIEQSVAEVVALADAQWRSGAFENPAGRSDARLIKAWARSNESWLGDGLESFGKPSVDVLDVVNRDGKEEDRVVLRVRVRIHCKHPKLGALGVRFVHLDERWTFGRIGSQWNLLSVIGDPLAGPILTAPLIPNASFDTTRLRQESLAELADAQKMNDDVALSDLVGTDEAPDFALLDLSAVDSRFLPALIAGHLARIIEAWELAGTGIDGPLENLASAQATKALLRSSGGTRLIVRDAVLKSWRPTRLDLARHPPAVEVALEVEAVRYLVRGDGGTVVGNQTVRHPMALMWTLELSGSERTPWRLVVSNDPARTVPGS